MQNSTELTLRIDWSEMDLFGHVNNVSFFKYVQASRVNLWEHLDIIRVQTEQTGPMLASASCRFIRPLYYPGQVRIVAQVEFIKNTSFGICHTLFNEKDEVVAEAKDVAVLFDFSTQEKMPIREALRKQLETLLVQ